MSLEGKIMSSILVQAISFLYMYEKNDLFTFSPVTVVNVAGSILNFSVICCPIEHAQGMSCH